MTKKAADFVVILDGSRSLSAASGRDPDKEFEFELPDTFLDDEHAILSFRADAFDDDPRLNVRINDTTVVNKLVLDWHGGVLPSSGALPSPRTIQKVIGSGVLDKNEDNHVRFRVSQGAVDISDVHLLIRVEV